MNMQINNNINNKGFSLIEVMIALVILAVGILGISSLQGTLIQNSSNANQRIVGISIAQKKIDDLKGFVNLTSADTWTAGASTSNLAAASLAYNHIEDDKGGAPTGSIDLLAGNVTVGNYNYTLNWTVQDYWHIAAFSAPSASTPSPAPANSALKLVTINVAWIDEIGDPQQVALSTVIDAYAPALTAFSDNPTATGGEGPKVQYTPLAAPDVVPVSLDIDGKKKESSKPIPDVSKKGDSTVVQFQTITFTPNASAITSTAVRQEEFLTAVCNCKNGTNTTSIIKGFFEWDPDDLILRDVASVVPASPAISNTTVDNGGGEDQHVACTACCRDSADIAGTTFKTCRMKRIDGVFRIYEPWGMIAFNIIPASYFNTVTGASGATASNSLPNMTSTVQASNIGLYGEYVKSVVRNALSIIQSTSAIPSTINTSFDVYVNGASTVANFVNGASTIDHKAFTVGGDPREYQVRALYIDIPPGEIYEGGMFTPTGASAVPLDRVPFFENNFTQVAGWIPDIDVGRSGANTGDQIFDSDYTDNHDDMDGSDCMQDDTPSAGRNYVTNEEFFYQGGGTTTDCTNASRGLFHPIVAASTVSPQAVSTIMFTANDGVVDRLVNPSAASVVKAIDLTVQ